MRQKRREGIRGSQVEEGGVNLKKWKETSFMQEQKDGLRGSWRLEA